MTQFFCSKQSQLPVYVCITHSENRDEQWFKDREKEILSDKRFQKLKSETKFNILFSGYVDSVNQIYTSVEKYKEDLEFVYNLRNSFIECLLQNHHKQGIPISSLPFYDKMKSEAKVIILELIEDLIRCVNGHYYDLDSLNKRKESYFQFTHIIDISTGSAYHALISDLISAIFSKKLKNHESILTGFSPKIYSNSGSLSLDWNKRKSNLPELTYKIYMN